MSGHSFGGPIEGETIIAGNTITGGSVIYNLRPGESKDDRCLTDLLGAGSQGTDPRLDKKNIEQIKGGLLRDSYRWILDNNDFRQWRSDPEKQLLWIRGDPGKGKTMLLCGIIDELGSIAADDGHLAYFFCQATNPRANKATAVLRGLIYMIVHKQTHFLSYVRKWYDHAGIESFEGRNAWATLSEILKNILHDSSLLNTYLVVDALDECETDRPKLLDFIVKNSSPSSRVKWIVSSRNWLDIEEQLERKGLNGELSLELNADSVSVAVKTYIDQKVRQLAEAKKYDENTENSVRKHLSSNSQDTFLWVALVYERLKAIRRGKALTALKAFPPGLDELYNRMINQVYTMDDQDDVYLCKQVFATAVMAYRPLTLDELASFIEPPNNDAETLEEIVTICGSFLAIRKRTVYFIHQSAKDFLIEKEQSSVFPHGLGMAHNLIFSKSLDIMSETLQRDIYGLNRPGALINDIEPPNPDPLATIRYSCVYWVEHLCWTPDQRIFSTGLRVSLMGELSKSVLSIRQLLQVIQSQSSTGSRIAEFLKDAERFVSSSGMIIERAPLQIYCASLAFCPTKSVIKTLYWGERLPFIDKVTGVRADFDHCLQTLDGQKNYITALAFSPDDRLLASVEANQGIIHLWDTATGTLCRMLGDHWDSVSAVAFSPDGKLIVSNNNDPNLQRYCGFKGTFKLWDPSTGVLWRTIECDSGSVNAVVFSPDSKLVASGGGYYASKLNQEPYTRNDTYFQNGTVKLWDVATGTLRQKIQGHSGSVTAVAFSPDGRLLVSSCSSGHFDGPDRVVLQLWDVTSGTLRWKFRSHAICAESVAFSPDGRFIAFSVRSHGSHAMGVELWDVNSGVLQRTLETRDGILLSASVNDVAFSPDSKLVACAGKQVQLWDVATGALQQELNHSAGAVTFSPNGQLVASGGARSYIYHSSHVTIKLWNVATRLPQETRPPLPSFERESELEVNNRAAFSPNGRLFASSNRDTSNGGYGMVNLWDVPKGVLLWSRVCLNPAAEVKFSPDSKIVASNMGVWDVDTGALKWEFHHPLRELCELDALAFSQDGRLLVSSHVAFSAMEENNIIHVWDVTTGIQQQSIRIYSLFEVSAVAISPDYKLVAVACDGEIVLCNRYTGACEQTLEGTESARKVVEFSPDGELVAASEKDTVKLWEVATGTLREIIHVGATITQMCFLKGAPYLKTNRGLVRIQSMQMDSPFQKPPIFVHDQWVARGMENILWLPPDYRGEHLVLQDSILAIAHELGLVTVIEFNLSECS